MDLYDEWTLDVLSNIIRLKEKTSLLFYSILLLILTRSTNKSEHVCIKVFSCLLDFKCTVCYVAVYERPHQNLNHSCSEDVTEDEYSMTDFHILG